MWFPFTTADGSDQVQTALSEDAACLCPARRSPEQRCAIAGAVKAPFDQGPSTPYSASGVGISVPPTSSPMAAARDTQARRRSQQSSRALTGLSPDPAAGPTGPARWASRSSRCSPATRAACPTKPSALGAAQRPPAGAKARPTPTAGPCLSHTKWMVPHILPAGFAW